MKTVKLFCVLIILLGACAPSKKPVAKKEASPTVTRTDLLRGGTSFSNAVVIMVETEAEGLNEEYRWLKNNYPGYVLVRKSHVKKAAKHYDIIRIRTQDRKLKEIYFDSTRFWGKY